MAAPRGLRNQDGLQALPNPERPAPAERVPAILTAAPSVILECDAGGAAHPARARGGPLDPAPTTLVGDLRLEPLRRLLRVSCECQPGQVVPFREDVLRLPKEYADFCRTEVVRFRLLQNGLARADDRLGLLDLGLAELHRPLDLSLLTLHREPLCPLEEISRVAVLSDGDCGPRGLMELLRLLRVCADVPGEGDVIGDESDRFLDLANPSKPRFFRTLAGLDEALPRRRKLIPVQGVAPSLPSVLGHRNRCAEVRGLTNRVPGEGEQIPHPVRFACMGHLRGLDEVLEERIVHDLALEEDVAGTVEERAGLDGVRVLGV